MGDTAVMPSLMMHPCLSHPPLGRAVSVGAVTNTSEEYAQQLSFTTLTSLPPLPDSLGRILTEVTETVAVSLVL